MKKDYKTIKEHKMHFNLFFSYNDIRNMIDKYNKPIHMPVPHWWYKKTDFGVYFLKEICNDNKDKIEEAANDDWNMFIPILKNYFVTYKEFKDIINNASYLVGIRNVPIEDTNFMTYILLKEFGRLSYKEMLRLPYKKAVILYLYAVANKMISRGILNPFKEAMESMFR